MKRAIRRLSAAVGLALCVVLPTAPADAKPLATGTPDGTIYKIICDGKYRGWIG